MMVTGEMYYIYVYICFVCPRRESAMFSQDKGGQDTIGCMVGPSPSEAIRKVGDWKGKLWMELELGGNTCVCEQIWAKFNGGCGATSLW